jgi:hypothetical protein
MKKKAAKKKKAKPVRKAEIVQGTAIVPVSPTQIIQPQTAIPTIKSTVENLERVRRFVTSCLNKDLQRELGKLTAKKLPTTEHTKEELALRERLEIDWGTIPGVDKPFLKQPGAEKFLFWLNLRPKFIVREVQLDCGFGHMEIIARVVVYSKKTEEEVFEGPDCSCTTMESNYRFRFTERDAAEKPPTQDEATKMKVAGLGKWRKKAIWAHGKKTGEQWVWFDRVENPNIYDERNKVRQIGEKRALVKCIRNMGALSEIFVADPSEWDIPDEDEGSPSIDDKYTEGGRRIIQPEPVVTCSRCGKERGFEKCLESPCPMRPSKYTPEQQKIVEEKTKVPVSVAGSETAKPAGAEQLPQTPSAPPAKKIVSAKPTETKNKGIKCLEVNWGGYVIKAFDLNLWQYITDGIGLDAEFVLAANKGSITGICRIGKRMFEENVPVVSMNEERKTGKELYL